MAPDQHETTWPSEAIEATMQGGWLHFYDPNGDRAAIPLDDQYGYLEGSGRPIWHAERNEDGTVTVTPSIHHVGHWHSPNPVTFRLVSELKDPKR